MINFALFDLGAWGRKSRVWRKNKEGRSCFSFHNVSCVPRGPSGLLEVILVDSPVAKLQ